MEMQASNTSSPAAEQTNTNANNENRTPKSKYTPWWKNKKKTPKQTDGQTSNDESPSTPSTDVPLREPKTTKPKATKRSELISPNKPSSSKTPNTAPQLKQKKQNRASNQATPLGKQQRQPNATDNDVEVLPHNKNTPAKPIRQRSTSNPRSAAKPKRGDFKKNLFGKPGPQEGEEKLSTSLPPALPSFDKMKNERRRREKREKPKKAKEEGDMPEKNGRTPSKRKQRDRFAPYITPEEAQRGIESGLLYKGSVRVNAHNRNEAYVTAEGMTIDIYIDGFTARNRAFEGDIVVVELNERSKWKLLSDSEKKEEAVEDEVPLAGLDEEKLVSVEEEISKLTLQSDEDEESEEEESDEPSEESDSQDSEEDEELEFEMEEEKLLGTSPSPSSNTNSNNASTSTAIPPVTPQSVNKESAIKSSDTTAMATPKAVASIKRAVAPMSPYVNPKGQYLQPSGRIVCILEDKCNKEQIGYMKTLNENGVVNPDDRFAIFLSMDPRVPKILVPISQIPEFYKNPKLYESKLVNVRLVTPWKSTSYLPFGKYVGVLGEAGEIPAETEALLKQNKIDYREFSPAIMDSLPKGQYQIPDSELAKRLDLRHRRIFTIDPPTAKDLDDALSVQLLPDGNYEVGVHIADVSFFVLPNTPLDKEASHRATTVYLIQKAITMLPHILCENLCSLNPGVDRLAFSVMWKLSPQGDIINEWFGRTVICSCSKMPYDVAQLIIEGKVTSSWNDEEVDKKFPDLGPAGKHTVPEIIQDVLTLQSIASQRRKRRFDNGALSMNNTKLSFKLDEKGNPISSYQYITREANHLVEEFMLLANERVAVKIAEAFPDTALLRNHTSPLERKLEGFATFCESLGFEFDISSGKAFADSLTQLKANLSPNIFYAMQQLATRPMQLAKYFCTGDMDPEDWQHYALNVKNYTHFTSPIRRYPDIIVHRLLQAAILLDEGRSIKDKDVQQFFSGLPKKEVLTKICEHCNDRKLNSRKAQESSGKLFLCLLLKDKPADVEAVVIGLGERFFTVMIACYGFESRIYMEDLPLSRYDWNEPDQTITLQWKNSAEEGSTSNQLVQKLKVLSLITVRVGVKPNRFPMDFQVTMLSPQQVAAKSN